MKFKFSDQCLERAAWIGAFVGGISTAFIAWESMQKLSDISDKFTKIDEEGIKIIPACDSKHDPFCDPTTGPTAEQSKN
ncbi:MAG: hypothetical protein F4226_07685 [Synechococcus sp. SB0678_bin_12]|nr:hypothetical protein [Synechococcus sp. SB0678_bin_12]